MSTVTVAPDPFHLVIFDAAVVRAVVADVAAQVEFPVGVDIVLTVDEAIPHPVTDRMAEIVDGVAELWCTGGCFESRTQSRTFSEPHARAEITMMLLRAKDRLAGGFEDAPVEADLTFGERLAWEAYGWGRAVRLGHNVHHQKRLYDFRLQHGFSDAADAAFSRLWETESMTWDGIREICAETGAAARPKSKTPIDVLRS